MIFATIPFSGRPARIYLKYLERQKMQMAHVNEVEFIGRVVGQVEKLKTSSGLPFVKMKVETERFVRSKSGQRDRIVQSHTVVIREKLSVPVMSEHAVAGVIVRIVGELSYNTTGKAEIVVWDHLGQAKLMQMPDSAETAKVNAPVAEPTKNAGGLGRMAAQKDKSADEDGGSDDHPQFESDPSASEKANNFLSGPAFEKSNFLEDDIPF
jgi:single-stranded DNA-binding protein